ncbi:hypothetical protein [Salipiger sp. PrR003]|uniref:hypothetical protein n=1 Tax=Salipiger sp. PrR003 TaxID=2706776 RepID=UPI0013DA998B|nr:hypothetical protein [Salipiger sp. PrR003]NDV53018.1 hypothetical protein [Salipiger sp. PrR003]
MHHQTCLIFLSPLAALAICAATPGSAQDAGSSFIGAAMPDQNTITNSAFGFSNGSIVVAPIPLSNPSLGSGLIVGGGYIFQSDAESDTSFFGLAAMRTDNGSEAVGAALNLSFGEGRWGVKLAYGKADVNYSLNLLSGINFGMLDIRQKGDIADVALSYGLTETISAGVEASWLKTTVTDQRLSAVLPPVIGDFGLEVEQITYGPFLEWNTVDDIIYPTSGHRVRYEMQKGEGLDGFNADFLRQTLTVDAYAPFGERLVLASKAIACQVNGDAPYFSLCGVGVTDGLRGYAAGLYFDSALASLQTEMRLRATKRIGLTVFGGGSVGASSFNEFGDAKILAAGGVGLRYRLSHKFPLDFSVDGAWNVDGEFSTYVYVGQRF